MTGETTDDFNAFRRTELIYQEKNGGFSYDETADFCRDKFQKHGSLLVVVNTKSSAKELYSRLSDTENAHVFHLSTNMCPQHRRKCINDIKEKLSENIPVICVTTQLIEAGVDISFGCVVRSLAGLDHAAQAAGLGTIGRRRHNRHTGFLNKCQRHRMIGHPNRHGFQTGTRQIQGRRHILSFQKPRGIFISDLYYGIFFENFSVFA